jgi:hypothetical protein
MPNHMDLSKFHVLCVISNPMRYGSRYRLYEQFAEDINRKGAPHLWTVELQAGARVHKVTEPENDKHIQVWKTHLSGTLWDKESMINIGISQIIKNYPDARYIAWVDADVRWEPGMIAEAQHALQHWDVIQLWSHSLDLGPNNESVGKIQQSFMYCHWKGIKVESQNGYTQGGHPGFAWAARRDALNKLGVSLDSGPLISFGALGSADRHMCCALVGSVDWSYHGDVHGNYKKWLHRWQAVAEKNIKRNVGYLTQTIRHSWHGRKADRGYSSRWKLLVKHQFDPETDLRRDVSGLWLLNSETPRQVRMRDDFRRYFQSRHEDSTDLV